MDFHALPAQGAGIVHQDDGVVYYDTCQHDQTDQRSHTDGAAGDIEGQEGAGEREGNGEEHHQREDHRLKLDCHDGKDQIDRDEQCLSDGAELTVHHIHAAASAADT